MVLPDRDVVDYALVVNDGSGIAPSVNDCLFRHGSSQDLADLLKTRLPDAHIIISMHPPIRALHMAKLIKIELGWLVVLAAASYHVAASVQAFIWPKIFWDFLTTNLDGAVKPTPTLQTINLVGALLVLAWEWPVPMVVGTFVHRSIVLRIVTLSFLSLSALLQYQTTNAGVYYLIGLTFYFWATVSLRASTRRVYPAARGKTASLRAEGRCEGHGW
ncbi:hypothetical protein JX266_014170 [Neoarthrinium moseri]|nr:hypothetical protein JX266_014170 [Neoarthrinium moseri]